MSSSALTAGQQILLESFQEITSYQDNDRAINILRQNNWNVQLAVNAYLSNDHDTSTTATQNNNEEVWRNVEENASNINDSWLANTILSPLKWVFSTRPSVINPEADARIFINDFNQKYGFQHPTFLGLSYQNAVSLAFRSHKPLLVYIHSPLHEDSNTFCEDILCTQNISHIIDENLCFWAGNIWSTEAYAISNQLKASCFPFLAVLVCQSERTVQVIDKIHGILEPNIFLERLNNAINTANPFVSRLRAELTRRYDFNYMCM